MRKKDRKLITAVLVDDQVEVRNALRRAMERDGRFEVVAELDDGAEAVETVTRLQPDAVVMDLAMPKMDGMETLPILRRISPDTKIVVLSSMIPFGGTRDEVITLGAAAAFDKYTAPKKVISAIALSVGEKR